VRVQDAGAAAYGGLVLSFAVSWPVLRLMGLEFWRAWDGMGIIMLVGMAVTRIGCLMNGCCSGRESRGLSGFGCPMTAANGSAAIRHNSSKRVGQQ
jgi:phosphatidylglycerol:prolipoprotein diacylglycerol transferase